MSLQERAKRAMKGCDTGMQNIATGSHYLVNPLYLSVAVKVCGDVKPPKSQWGSYALTHKVYLLDTSYYFLNIIFKNYRTITDIINITCIIYNIYAITYIATRCNNCFLS